MNIIFAELLDDVTPKFNHEVLNGLATRDVKTAPEYIDAIIKSSMRSATPKLEYHGWRKLSPEEEYDSLFGNNSNRIDYDVAVSDLYKIELLFTYNGVKLPRRYLYMPFLDDGGIMHISDTKYHIVPVLSDTVVSPNEKEVFIRLLRDKLTFKRTNRNILCNGEKISGDVIFSTMYRTSSRTIKDALGNIVPPIALYLFAEHGLKETFIKYAGIEPIVTYESDLDKYKDKYNIYSSTRLKPRTLKDNNYIGHDVSILIPKDVSNPLVDNLVTGFIYTLDVNYHKAREMTDTINNGKPEKEIIYWKLLLGRIIFKDNFSADRVYADIVDHFTSLRSYIDSLIKAKLEEINIYVNDFFDLLAVILGKYSNWLLNSKSYSNNIFNRYVDVLYYIMYDIILGVNKTIFEITRKSMKKDLTDNEVSRVMNHNLSPKKIYSIVKSSATNLTLLLVDVSGDNKYFKMTSVLELQERGKNVTKSKSTVFPKATHAITGPDLYMGSILYLTKKAPTPKIRINPFITLDPITGRLKPSKEIMSKVRLLDDMFNGKLDETRYVKISKSEFETEIET